MKGMYKKVVVTIFIQVYEYFFLYILGSEPTMICGNPLLCSIHNPQFPPILPILTHWSHELPTLPI